jgi:hypothetical protein
VMSDIGEPTPVELTLRQSDPAHEWYPDEDDVMRIAAVWSFDPSALTSDSGPAGLGMLGVPGR